MLNNGDKSAAKVCEAVLGMFTDRIDDLLLDDTVLHQFLLQRYALACNTYQFSDYSRYAMTVFKEEDKRKYRDEHFDTDLKNAYELGKRLVGKCQEG